MLPVPSLPLLILLPCPPLVIQLPFFLFVFLFPSLSLEIQNSFLPILLLLFPTLVLNIPVFLFHFLLLILQLFFHPAFSLMALHSPSIFLFLLLPILPFPLHLAF
jgi:hypothetical protein